LQAGTALELALLWQAQLDPVTAILVVPPLLGSFGLAIVSALRLRIRLVSAVVVVSRRWWYRLVVLRPAGLPRLTRPGPGPSGGAPRRRAPRGGVGAARGVGVARAPAARPHPPLGSGAPPPPPPIGAGVRTAERRRREHQRRGGQEPGHVRGVRQGERHHA